MMTPPPRFGGENILNSSIHKIVVGETLFLKNEFFPYPPFEKYIYKILSKKDSVSVSKRLLQQEHISIADGNYVVCNEIIHFKFNFPGIVFIEITNTTNPSAIPSSPMNIIVEVSPTSEDVD